MYMILVILMSVYSGIIYAGNNHSAMFENVSADLLLGHWQLSKDFKKEANKWGRKPSFINKCSSFFEIYTDKKNIVVQWDKGFKTVFKNINSSPLSSSRTFAVGGGKATYMKQTTLQENIDDLQLQLTVDHDDPYISCTNITTLSLDTESNILHFTYESCSTHSWIEQFFVPDDPNPGYGLQDHNLNCLYSRKH